MHQCNWWLFCTLHRRCTTEGQSRCTSKIVLLLFCALLLALHMPLLCLPLLYFVHQRNEMVWSASLKSVLLHLLCPMLFRAQGQALYLHMITCASETYWRLQWLCIFCAPLEQAKRRLCFMKSKISKKQAKQKGQAKKEQAKHVLLAPSVHIWCTNKIDHDALYIFDVRPLVKAVDHKS